MTIILKNGVKINDVREVKEHQEYDEIIVEKNSVEISWKLKKYLIQEKICGEQ